MLNKRFIGSQLALVLGTSGMLGGITAISSDGSTGGLFTGPLMILGAAAYSSRKRRRIGLKPETAARKTFEGICLGLITTMWLGVSDLGNAMMTEPASHLITPLWALIAYPCAGFRIAKKPEAIPPEQPRSSATRTVLWSIPVAMALTIAGTATISTAGRIAGSGSEQHWSGDREPARPSQAVLERVEPLGIQVALGDVQQTTDTATGESQWQVLVSCFLAEGEEARLISPTAGERWLFGVLWGDGPYAAAVPRSYIQAIPQVTLWLTDPATGARWEAAFGRFYRCPLEVESMMFPLWPEDASALLNRTGIAEVAVTALGMPRSPEMAGVIEAESIEEIAERLMWVAINFDEMAVPVDGLVNGGPVFEVRELTQ